MIDSRRPWWPRGARRNAVQSQHRAVPSLSCAAAALLATLTATPAVALEHRIGNTVVVAAGEVIDGDLYVLATTIVIDGTVTGDVMAHGLLITLNGTVGGDLTACGESVIVNGTVGDDLRTAGWMLTLGAQAHIADSVLVGGFSSVAEPGSRIEGDLLLAGYRARLAGDIDGDAVIEASEVELLGTVAGRVDVEPDSGAVEEDSRLRGVFSGGGVDIGHRVRRLMALMIVGLLVVWLAPQWPRRLGVGLARRPLRILGRGAASAVGLVGSGIVVLLLTTLLGLALGAAGLWSLVWPVVGLGLASVDLLVTGLGGVAGVIAPIVVGSTLGERLLVRAELSGMPARFLPLAIGLILLALISSVPYVGRLVASTVTLLGLGTCWTWCRARPLQGTAEQAPG